MIDALGGMGCQVVSAAARPTAGDLEEANAAGMLISRCEAAAFHRRLGLDRSLYWDEVADQLDAAEELSAVEYLDAQTLRADLADRLSGRVRRRRRPGHAHRPDGGAPALPTSPAI